MKKIFEAYKEKPDVNELSPEFWKMVRLANWESVVKADKGGDDRMAYEMAQKRIYLKYTYPQIQGFFAEYKVFYDKLHDYFKPIWLNGRYNRFMPSDDGYWDLLTTLIGRGKTYLKSCIDDTSKFVEVAKKDDFTENFSYLLQIDEKEYMDIKMKYDPFWKDVRKYNI